METRIREVNEIHVYKLHMRDLRHPLETFSMMVAIADNREKLEELLEEHKADEPYSVTVAGNPNQGVPNRTFTKFFKEGSPLEWVDPEYRTEEHGISDEWVVEEHLFNFIADNKQLIVLGLTQEGIKPAARSIDEIPHVGS